ncbi:MAG: hypothetical protein QOJ58_1466, partial [Alphaproteobacteria bacterium]|nr:hypothetical protein [Alphaproteobacteria bacterium]
GGIVIVSSLPDRRDSGNSVIATFCNRDISANPAVAKVATLIEKASRSCERQGLSVPSPSRATGSRAPKHQAREKCYVPRSKRCVSPRPVGWAYGSLPGEILLPAAINVREPAAASNPPFGNAEDTTKSAPRQAVPRGQSLPAGPAFRTQNQPSGSTLVEADDAWLSRWGTLDPGSSPSASCRSRGYFSAFGK